jgi:hypothetical protein
MKNLESILYAHKDTLGSKKTGNAIMMKMRTRKEQSFLPQGGQCPQFFDEYFQKEPVMDIGPPG